MKVYSLERSAPYDIEAQPDTIEQLGTKAKVWLEGKQYLFKRGRSGTVEDWAEVVSSALCEILGIPHAKYQFAKSDKNELGVISTSIVPKGGILFHGNDLIAEKYRRYDKQKIARQIDYRLLKILNIFRLYTKSYALKPPLTYKEIPGIKTPFDIFLGYLMFDTLIGNQDRHHENWGIIRTNDGNFFLAETFDHASSLGRVRNDKKRLQILEGVDPRQTIREFCAKAETPFYDKNPDTGSFVRLKTIDAFMWAARNSKRAAKSWIEQLNNLSDDRIQHIFSSLPKLENSPTKIAADFAIAMLHENMHRLKIIGKTL